MTSTSMRGRAGRLARVGVATLALGVLAGCASSAASAPDLEQLEPPTAAPEVVTLGILGDSMSLPPR